MSQVIPEPLLINAFKVLAAAVIIFVPFVTAGRRPAEGYIAGSCLVEGPLAADHVGEALPAEV